MVDLDLEEIAAARAAMLRERNPGLETDWSVEEGDWALLTLKEEGALIGFEFLETDRSWTRPDALIQYFEAANDGFYVAVIVPSSRLVEVTDLIYSMGEDPIAIIAYSDIGIEEKIRA